MEKKKTSKVNVRLIGGVNEKEGKLINKSDKMEHINNEEAVNAAEWISHPVDMLGLRAIVDESTILPQCINAYGSNIAGFGMRIRYKEEQKNETQEMKEEWDRLSEILMTLNMDKDIKEVFEEVIKSRETFGISYVEIVRDMEGNVVQMEHIAETHTIDMTYPLEPYQDAEYWCRGNVHTRKKKFRKFRQMLNGKTVYFKEFGDKRIMDKRSGEYIRDGEKLELENQANEILEFRIGTDPYGKVRWVGQILVADGNYKAEKLNNNYFRKGRHTPLALIVKGGTLTDESYRKLEEYMYDIEGEKGQHEFLVLETDTLDTTFEESKQPEVELKDMANILQKDELFQEYQENGRKKIQSSFLLPDIYTGYTTDFNRATAQTAMEVTEKQIFQPERASLEWIINGKLLNEYHFKYVEAYFDSPNITNPDDIKNVLDIAERAGGVTPNIAKQITYSTLGIGQEEDYEGEWGNIPLAKAKLGEQKESIAKQVDEKIAKAQKESEDEALISVLKELRKSLDQD